MKIHWILVLISLSIAALAGYGFYAGTSNLFLTFAFAGFKQAAYIIITGILFLLYLMIFYAIAKTLKE